MFKYAIPSNELAYYIVMEIVIIAVALSFFKPRKRTRHVALFAVIGAIVFVLCMFLAYAGVLEYLLPTANRLLFMVTGTTLACFYFFDVSHKQMMIIWSSVYLMMQVFLALGVEIFCNTAIHIAWKYICAILVCAVDYFLLWLLYIRKFRKEIYLKDIYTPFLIAVEMFRIFLTAWTFNVVVFAGIYTVLYGFFLYVFWCQVNVILIAREFSNKSNAFKLAQQKIIESEKELQYQTFLSNIETINTKCHDLKRYTRELESSGKASMGGAEEYLGEITKALNIYESISNTGNTDLDSVLSEKKNICDRSGIALDYVIDARDLSFMTGFDIYMMFGNALENAIEGSLKEDEDKRMITVRIGRRGNIISVSVRNYCSGNPKFSGGLPVTSKSDDRYHGYGSLSIRKIAQKYGGNAEFSCTDSCFRMNAIIPVQSAEPGTGGLEL